jgi:PAS domain S-box-containing protein
MDPNTLITSPDTPEFLAGGGEMGQRIRSYDWSKTSLGPVETWPQSLRTCIRIMLTSRQPIWIGWGKELIKFYNDPYKAIAGGKHPRALGHPASVVWRDIWKDIEPMLRQVMEQDQGTYVESQLLIMERNGYPEETYYTFSYTPIPGDDGKTAGMFCANTDDTDKIISERQLRSLTQLGKELADCRSTNEIYVTAIKTLNENQRDFPFACFRTIRDNKAILEHCTDNLKKSGIPDIVNLDEDNVLSATLRNAIQSKQPQVFHALNEIFTDAPSGSWEVPPDKMMVIPIYQTADEYCILSVGLNPYRLLDEKYKGFFSLVADQITTSFSEVHILEEERKRAEALAEIDRAKTTFFSNISHEFRTPLTLLLGPVEEVLNDPQSNEDQKRKMDVAYRNALRMQKLVNTLLDFARIEAGRSEGKFSKVDICRLTEDLASTFRSMIEKSGMKLIFDCSAVSGEVYVDVDMWEKIVLNLISNAFKYTNEGSITVKVAQEEDHIKFSVKDAGVGIPEDQHNKVFQRFHRVENVQGRSGEGTGIGLAMVRELVRLHHGEITLESKPGSGSEFTVSIPVGKNHISPDKIAAGDVSNYQSVYSDTYVLEALRWLPHEQEKLVEVISDFNLDTQHAFKKKGARPTILLADDNADMRDYVQRLLSGHFHVLTANDGEDAYRKLLMHLPELVISDVMMPKLDGFGLLTRIRSNTTLKNIPVIFLSARAGEEARVEGLDAGADDYLVKPFSAKELLARVETSLRISRTRLAAQKNVESLFKHAPVGITILRGIPLSFELVNDEVLKDWNKREEDVAGRPWFEVFPELKDKGMAEMLDSVMKNGQRFVAYESPFEFDAEGKKITKYFNYVVDPLWNENGKCDGVMTVGVDVTMSVLARKRIEDSESYFRNMADTVPAILWVTEKDGSCSYLNRRWYEITGQTQEEALGFGWLDATHPDDLQKTSFAFTNANEKRIPFNVNYRLRQLDGSYRWSNDSGLPRYNSDGEFEGFIGSVVDIHEQKIAEQEIRESEQQLNELANAMPQLVWVAKPSGEVIYYNDRVSEFAGARKLNGLWIWEGLVHPDHLEETNKVWKQAISTGTPYQTEHLIKMKDGNYRWFLSRALPLKNEEGKILKWFGTATDIHTAREYSAVLEEEVRKRTVELNELNQSLKHSNQELQQFAHVASHDLKEPLRKIKTFAGRLAKDPDNVLSESSKLYLNKVNSASDRMSAMVEGVLNYSVINVAQQNLQLIDLNDVVENIESDLELVISAKKAVIEYEHLPSIEGSYVLLYQMLYNLVNNSLKFSRKDVPPHIRISSQTFRDNIRTVQLKVEDNGIGFDPDYAETIFQSFSRLNSKDQFEGTGLGLSLCKRIAERHGGSIRAIGNPGVGSTFVITLPLHQARTSI